MEQRSRRRGRRRRTPLGAVLAVLVLGILLTGASVRRQSDQARDEQRDQLATLTEDTSGRILATWLRYGDLVDSLSAFEATSDGSAASYEAYVRTLDVSRIPGVDNTAFIARVATEDLAAFEARQRSVGQPAFTIERTIAGPQHAIVVHAAPEPATAPGLDLSGDPSRSTAMQRAMDTGLPMVTGAVVPLAQRHLPAAEQDFVVVVYKAVYDLGAPRATVEERRAAVRGWISVPVTLSEVLASLGLERGLLDVTVIDATSAGTPLLAESRPGAAARIATHTVRDETTIDTGNLELAVRTAFAPGRVSGTFAWPTAVGGVVATLLAAYGLFASLRFRRGLLARAEADREQAELLRSRFHAAVDRAPVGVTVVSLDGTVQLVNHRLRELLRVPDGSDALSIFEYYQPEERADAAAQIARLAAGEVESLVRDRRLRRADGTALWCRVSSSWVPGPDGRPTAIVGHVQDIEAERRAIDELASRTRWFSSIVERSSDLILLLDAAGLATWVSPSLREIVGVSEEDILGHRLVDLILPEDQDLLAEAFRTLQPGHVTRVEFRVTDTSGAVVWLETTATNLLDDPDVASVITLSRDVTERHRTTAALAHRAAHDPLTGVLNRAGMEEQLPVRLARGAETGESVTLAFLDLDGFKGINDAFGHAAGDELLRVVARCLRDEVRSHDVIARLGGDEFVLALSGASLPDALDVADRIRRRLAEPLLLPAMDEPVQVSVSIGLAVATAGDDGGSLLHAADLALYEAKRRGRNRIEVSTRGVASLGAEVDDLLEDVLRDSD